MGWLKKLVGKEKTPEAPFTEITDDNFEHEVLLSELPVMLFVWSDTCPHCKKMAPNIKEVANLHAARLKAAHTNSGLAPKVMAALDVRGVPSTFFLQKGNVVEHVAGFRPVSYLDELVQALTIPKG